MSSDLDTDIASVHALFQSYDGMEGLTGVTIASPVQPHLTGWRAFFFRIYPGLLVAATIALAATWLSQQYRSPVMLFALLFGMTFHFLYEFNHLVGMREPGNLWRTQVRSSVSV